jgi:hypothetical protein
MTRARLREEAVRLRRDYRDLLAVPPPRGTAGQQRAERIEQARQRALGHRRPARQLELDLR